MAKQVADIYIIQDRVIQACRTIQKYSRKKQQAGRRLEETSRKKEIKYPETSRETELKCIKRQIKRQRK